MAGYGRPAWQGASGSLGTANYSFRNPMAKAQMNNNPMGNQASMTPTISPVSTMPDPGPVGDMLYRPSPGGGSPPAVPTNNPIATRPPAGPPANRPPGILSAFASASRGMSTVSLMPSRSMLEAIANGTGFSNLIPQNRRLQQQTQPMQAAPAPTPIQPLQAPEPEMQFTRPRPLQYFGYRSSMNQATPEPGQRLYNPNGGYGAAGQGINPGAGIIGPKRENMSPDEYRVLQGGKPLITPRDINPSLPVNDPNAISGGPSQSTMNARIARAARMRGVTSAGIDQWRASSPMIAAMRNRNMNAGQG